MSWSRVPLDSEITDSTPWSADAIGQRELSRAVDECASESHRLRVASALRLPLALLERIKGAVTLVKANRRFDQRDHAQTREPLCGEIGLRGRSRDDCAPALGR